ncbi:MAG TPA: FAD-dependent monooxygenase [Planctomycetaceae bacterium]|jgi:2-polyprenyl-6-methoxyphenol hydroxylase-like FAD-dependent oxidoreductase
MVSVIIIGGGIGGLTAALALGQRGIDVAVYETAPALRPVGKGIWVPTNAMTVFRRLGRSEAISQAGWTLEKIQIRDVADGVLQEVDLRHVAARYGHSTVSIHRAVLVQLLADALPAGTLHLGKRCAGFEQDEREVRVRFADGTVVHGDVLIGADGIHSTIREQLFPVIPLRYSGQTCYRGIADWQLPPDLSRTCREIWGGANRIGFSAVGPGQLYWFAPQLAPANSPAPAAPLAEWLADQYARFPAPVPEMLRHTPSADIVRTDLCDFAPLRHWSQGRVVLLGDAAHAMTPNLGQGGAQAVEDAYVLAEHLSLCQEPQKAIRAYENIRLRKVRWIVNTARQHGRMAHLRNPLARKARNWLIKHAPEWLTRRQLDRMYSLNY